MSDGHDDDNGGDEAFIPGTLPGLLPPATFEAPENVEARGVGRPKGAKNKRSEHWQKYIAATGEHPVVFLAKLFRADTEQLAQRMGCKTIEALRVQKDAATDLLPYIEQKLPLAIETPDADKLRPVIVIGAATAEQADLAEQRFGLRLVNGTGRSEENQAVSDAETVRQSDDKSDAQPNLLELQAKDDE